MTLTVDPVLLIAETQVNVTECPPNSNKGLKVEEYLKVVGLGSGYPWCAAFVAYCGQKAYGEAWPLPLVGGCQTLYEWAAKKKLIVTAPERGAVFLKWHPELNRFAHTGFCLSATDTIEGNTSGAGSREGWGVFSRKREWAPTDRFIKWWQVNP